MNYIGLLRAVNVGGKNKIKMAELRHALEAIDLQQVRTYIQSGNLIFDADDAESAVQQRIEHQIEKRFGLHIDVVLRTLTDFDRMIENCPFLEHDQPKASPSIPANLHVALLHEPPPPDTDIRLSRYGSEDEQYQISGRDIYLFLPQGTAHSKLTPQLQKLGTAATLRNWKTIQKLHSLAHRS